MPQDGRKLPVQVPVHIVKVAVAHPRRLDADPDFASAGRLQIYFFDAERGPGLK
jgi:hypothetical protein